MSALVVAGKVDLAGLVTHQLPLSGLPEALELMKGEAGKVLLDPSVVDPSLVDPVSTGAHAVAGGLPA
jgi:threonine 3-dehydrogenase